MYHPFNWALLVHYTRLLKPPQKLKTTFSFQGKKRQASARKPILGFQRWKLHSESQGIFDSGGSTKFPGNSYYKYECPHTFLKTCTHASPAFRTLSLIIRGVRYLSVPFCLCPELRWEWRTFSFRKGLIPWFSDPFTHPTTVSLNEHLLCADPVLGTQKAVVGK